MLLVPALYQARSLVPSPLKSPTPVGSQPAGCGTDLNALAPVHGRQRDAEGAVDVVLDDDGLVAGGDREIAARPVEREVLGRGRCRRSPPDPTRPALTTVAVPLMPKPPWRAARLGHLTGTWPDGTCRSTARRRVDDRRRAGVERGARPLRKSECRRCRCRRRRSACRCRCRCAGSRRRRRRRRDVIAAAAEDEVVAVAAIERVGPPSPDCW